MFSGLTLSGSGLAKQPPPRRKSSPKPRRATQAQPPAVNPLSRVAISLEYASLRYQSHCPLGMYVVPLVGDPSIWDAVLFIHQGYYTDSILKFRLTFPHNYPRPTSDQHHVYDILYYIKASFKKHALDQIKEGDCLNREAFRRSRRYHDTTSSFAALATQSSMLSQTASALFDQDHPSMANTKGPPHSLIFRELKPEQSDALRARLDLHAWEDAPRPT
ncbi:UBC-like protein [Lactarius hengduanensis]|nr:UBC-like protein [Lactarius hengduanensis]